MDIKVSGIQGVPITETTPTDGQVLTYIGANSDWEPKTSVNAPGFNDVTKTGFREDFLNFLANTNVTSEIAVGCDTGWLANRIVGTGGSNSSVNFGSSTFANPGTISVGWGNPISSGDGTVLYKASGDGTTFGILGANSPWEADFIFAVNGNTDVCIRVGFCDQGDQTADPSADGFWVRYDTSAGDTKFTWETRHSSVSTVSVTNSINVDANFHHFKIRSVVSGTVGFSVDGGTEYTTTSHVPPSQDMIMFLQDVSRGTQGFQSLLVDFVSYFATPGRA